MKLDIWEGVSVRNGLRVLGHRADILKMDAKDTGYNKPAITNIERRNDVAAADDLHESMNKLKIHLSTALMKMVATLSANKLTKRWTR